jgi:hypothetical protein
MATRSYGSLAKKAAAYIAGGGNVIPVSRGGAQESRAQSDRLRKSDVGVIPIDLIVEKNPAFFDQLATNY